MNQPSFLNGLPFLGHDLKKEPPFLDLYFRMFVVFLCCELQISVWPGETKQNAKSSKIKICISFAFSLHFLCISGVRDLEKEVPF